MNMNKDKRWLIQNDPGILRKKADAETDLFVFGYACKIFRDDHKALEMDQGKHLIPWMGDETLKVDRYDARGHLSEVSQFEGTNQDYVLTAEERRIEQICDEERYRALHHNEEEQEMYQEEELKRLKQALSSDKEYGQVAYQYDNERAPPPNTEPEKTLEDEEPFVPSPSLFLPANMTLPTSVKENQIIEKTAVHIASHGPQVEILIKTRQANNQKLSFLHVGSPLNSYYNFILGQIKTGRYKPAFMIQQEAESSHENDDHYLHPSLAPVSTTVESAPSIPSIAYKPSSDCSYNLLVNKIRNMQQSQINSVGEREEPSTSEDSSTFRRKRRKRSSIQTQPPTPVQKQVAVPPQHVKEIISRLINFAHSRDLHPSEIASNLLKQDSKNLGFVKPGHKYHDYYVQQLQETYKENIYNLSNPSMETVENEEMNRFTPVNDPERTTEDDLDDSVSSRTPSVYQESTEAASSPVENDSDIPCSPYNVSCQPYSKPAPVCFSIKKPKETERLGHASAFPLEESSTDEEGKSELDLIPSTQDSGIFTQESGISTQGNEISTKENGTERLNEGDGNVSSYSTIITSEESGKSTAKSSKVKEKSKPRKQSPASTSSVEVVVVSTQTSSSRRKSTSENSPITVSSSSSNRRSSGTSSSKDRRHTSSSESSRRPKSSDKSWSSATPSQRSHTSSETSSRRSFTSSSSGISRKSREMKYRRKYKSSSSSSADKYKDHRGREKNKALDEKCHEESVMKIRNESDDLPPLPEDPILNLTSVPEENLEKKREERKKKVKQMIEKIKTESFGLQENSQTLSQGGPATANGPVSLTSNGSMNFPKSPLSLSTTSFILNKSSGKTEGSKTDPQKDFEEQLREQVKQSLKKIAETTLAALPPITEDSGSQFEHSSAANSNGFETPTPSGRPTRRASLTPFAGLTDINLQEINSSRSNSSFASRKSHKKRKHHKKKKKRKGHSKSKKRHDSSSESSSSDDESSDDSDSSTNSEVRPKKHHKKASKRSHKRRKRKHRKRRSSSSSSTD